MFLHKLWRKRHGTASIEFAFAVPALLALFLGVFEVSQALIMYMKVIDVAETISDLIAQQKQVNGTDISNYYLAGQLVMTPSPPGGLGVAVASVTFDPVNGNPSVAWQLTRGGASNMADATTAATGLGLQCQGASATPCDSVILAQASYTYNSALGYLLHQAITMTARVSSRPRAVFVIPCVSPCT